MSDPTPVFSAAIDRDNPWPGLASFTEDARAFFFGREKETDELVRLVRRNTLTVLFGQSGLGKSSLLQAGAFPQLREADFLPLYLRLDHGIEVARASRPWSEHGRDAHTTADHGQDARATSTLADQVKAALVAAFKSVGADAPAPRADESLWEYFHRKDIDIWSAKNRLLTPILAFDQFEEIFTLGRATDAQRERGRAFLAELADLVENRPPAALRAKFDAGELDPARYAFDKPSCQVILSLREDFLPDLEGLKNEMRSIMHSRMRVRRLNGTQALEIVTRPAPHLLAEGVAERIVEFVAGVRGGSVERLGEMEVEPALLSVICRELNERRRALGQAQITADLVSGNRREILTDFYERSVADLPEAMRTFVEDHLLTKSGFRDNLALETALDFPGVTRPLLDTLVSRRLVRLEDRLGVQRVELTHDVLAEVIRGSRDTRHQRQTLEDTKQRERVTRRRMWLARTIAAGLLVGLTGVSWVAWRAIHAEREQTRLRADADTARKHADALRVKAEVDELAALRKAYASDMNGVQNALASDNLGRARELLDRHRPEPGEVDLRGWEWRYLWQFCRSDATAILKEPNDNSIISLAVSGDGQWLAAGGLFGGELFVLNLATKEKIKVPAGAGNVRVVFSPRAPLLAIGIDDRERGIGVGVGAANALTSRVLLWDATTRKIVREIPLAGACFGVNFSSDGQTLAVVDIGSESTISLWRVADGAKLASWTGGSGFSSINTTFATTPDLNFAAFPLFTASGNRGVRVLDLKTGQERGVIVPGSSVAGLALSPDGAMLATTPGSMAEGSPIQLWEVASGREIGRLDGHRGRVGQMIFLADGKQLLSASADQTLRLWDLGTRTAARTFRGHKTEVWTVQLMSDQRTIVSGCKDGSVYRWDLQAGRETSAAWTIERGTGRAWAYAGGGEFIVNVDANGRVTRRQGRTFQEEKPILEVGPLLAGGLTTAVFDQRQPLLAVATEGEKVQVWDWERRRLVREFPGRVGSQRVVPQRFSQDGASLAVRLSSGMELFAYREWEIATGRETRSFDFTLAPSTSFRGTFSPDGTKFAHLISPSGEGQLLDLQSGRTTPLKLNVRVPMRPGFSPDGGLLVVPSLQSSLRIFDVAANREVAALGGYMFGVHSANVSPDGKRFVSGGTGVEAIALWDAQSHERLLTLAARTSLLSSVEFSPDGNVLAAGVSTLHFWRAPTWAEIEQAEAAERAGAGR